MSLSSSGTILLD